MLAWDGVLETDEASYLILLLSMLDVSGMAEVEPAGQKRSSLSGVVGISGLPSPWTNIRSITYRNRQYVLNCDCFDLLLALRVLYLPNPAQG